MGQMSSLSLEFFLAFALFARDLGGEDALVVFLFDEEEGVEVLCDPVETSLEAIF